MADDIALVNLAQFENAKSRSLEEHLNYSFIRARAAAQATRVGDEQIKQVGLVGAPMMPLRSLRAAGDAVAECQVMTHDGGAPEYGRQAALSPVRPRAELAAAGFDQQYVQPSATPIRCSSSPTCPCGGCRRTR